MYDISIKQNNNSNTSRNNIIKFIDSFKKVEENPEIDLNQIKLAIKNIGSRVIFNKNDKFEIEISGFFKYICNCFINPKDRESFDILDIGKKFIVGKLDLMYYLKMIDQINSIKSLLLKPYQIFLLDNQKKINLFSKKEKIHLDIRDNENLSSDNEMHLLLIQIIINKIKEQSLEAIDCNFYENIDPYIKKLVDDLVYLRNEKGF